MPDRQQTHQISHPSHITKCANHLFEDVLWAPALFNPQPFEVLSPKAPADVTHFEVQILIISPVLFVLITGGASDAAVCSCCQRQPKK